MRVIAGSARGMPLRVPSAGARPTSDRVREALFSILGARVVGARVLDLFAGSGAMGIEALSRGAAHATFVDDQSGACEVIGANLAKTRLASSATVRAMDVFRFLRRTRLGDAFDLVFADPPYRKRPTDRDFTAELLAEPDWAATIAPHAILVLESGRNGAKDVGPFWEESDRRCYGDTVLTFLVPASA